MILLRLRDSVDDHLLQHQCAYREGHSTQMHILALADLVERACHDDEPLYAVFTDFSKAFDSIDRHHLLQLLRAWGMPLRLVDYLDRAHAQQRLYLRFDGTSMTSPIAPAVGVMQGDTLAPYLFILVVDQILRSLDYEAGVPVHTSNLRAPLKVAALAYADDVVLTCPSVEQAQRQLCLFEDAALLWGLHLNTKKGKTELLIATTRSRRDSAPDFLQCRAGVVGRTHSYRYLGWLVTDRGAQDWKEDFAHRTRLAWATLHTNERLWRSPASARTKTRLFNALVVPVLTYAFWAYPISADCILHVHVTANKLLRHALGIRVEFSDPDLHTHTEDLYVHSPG
eukprot:PhM_4_TR8460/c3_g1_i2/m.47252